MIYFDRNVGKPYIHTLQTRTISALNGWSFNRKISNYCFKLGNKKQSNIKSNENYCWDKKSLRSEIVSYFLCVFILRNDRRHICKIKKKLVDFLVAMILCSKQYFRLILLERNFPSSLSNKFKEKSKNVKNRIGFFWSNFASALTHTKYSVIQSNEIYIFCSLLLLLLLFLMQTNKNTIYAHTQSAF